MTQDTKWTSGPLHVVQQENWPWQIEVHDAEGNCVSTEQRTAYSSRHKTLNDVMTGYDMPDVQEAVFLNERQVADMQLRAAAPELYEALEEVLSCDVYADAEGLLKIEYSLDSDVSQKARNALAKARGEIS